MCNLTTSFRHIFVTSLTSSTIRYHSYTPEDIAGGYGRMPLIRNGEQRTRLSTGRRCRQPSQICSWQQRDFEVTAKSKDQLSSPYRQSIRQPQWQAESQAFDIIGGKLIPGWGGQPNRINTKKEPQKGVSSSKIWDQTSRNTKHKTTDLRLLISATILYNKYILVIFNIYFTILPFYRTFCFKMLFPWLLDFTKNTYNCYWWLPNGRIFASMGYL